MEYNKSYVIMKVNKKSKREYFLKTEVNERGEVEKITWTTSLMSADSFETINLLLYFMVTYKVEIKSTEFFALLCERCNDGICEWITID